MPITLNHSNINVQYETGKNYNIETVKSDLYVRDSRIGISSNLTGEPVSTPSVVPTTEGNPITHKTLTYTFNQGNIVAYYKFNGDYTDSNLSSTKYNLSATGTLDFQTTRFIEGQSVLFNGDNEFLSTNVNFPNQFGMSYSFWFLLDDITANRNILGIGSDFLIMLQPQVNKIYITNTMAGNETYTTPTVTFSSNTWYHMVFMFLANGTWKLYLNGVDLNINGLGGTYPLTAAKLPTGKLFIGGKSNIGYYANVFYRGNVDEFFAFNKELSQTEITSLYNKTFSLPANEQQYTLNFPVPTTTDILERTAGRGILNNSNLILQGTYDINLTASSATIVPRTGQYLPFTATSNLSQNIAFRYHLLNPIKMPEGAQWTYSSNNANVYHLGDVGIGTTNPSYDLHVNGTIFTSTGGYTQTGLTTWTVMSDKRIKDNIVKASYEKCLENVKNIELYNFNFKDNYVNTNDRRQLGFIAQEVQQVYPKAVEVGKMIIKNNDGIENILSLNTTQIEYTLYGAVKKLIGNIEEMENEIAEIENTSNITTHA